MCTHACIPITVLHPRFLHVLPFLVSHIPLSVRLILQRHFFFSVSEFLKYLSHTSSQTLRFTAGSLAQDFKFENWRQTWWFELTNPALGGRSRRSIDSRPAWATHQDWVSNKNRFTCLHRNPGHLFIREKQDRASGSQNNMGVCSWEREGQITKPF